MRSAPVRGKKKKNRLVLARTFQHGGAGATRAPSDDRAVPGRPRGLARLRRGPARRTGRMERAGDGGAMAAALRAAKRQLRGELRQRLRALGAAEKQRQSRLLGRKVGADTRARPRVGHGPEPGTADRQALPGLSGPRG